MPLADMLRVIETGCDGMTINWPDWLAPPESQEHDG